MRLIHRSQLARLSTFSCNKAPSRQTSYPTSPFLISPKIQQHRQLTFHSPVERPLITNNKTQPCRSLSSSSNPHTFSRAFPQYTIFGDNSALALKPIVPTFKQAGTSGGAIVLDKKGSLLVEFSPRSASSKGYLWNEKISFSLSPEEIGLIGSAISNNNSVELVRKTGGAGWGKDDGDGRYNQIQAGGVDKVISIAPCEEVHGAVIFTVDFVKDGAGGQMDPNSRSQGPLSIMVQAGEWQVVNSILKESIFYLIGWKDMMEISCGRSVADANRTGGGGERFSGGSGGLPF